MLRLTAILFIGIVVSACSVLKKDDPEQSVRIFLTNFQNSLSGTDDQILAQFEATQSKQALLAIVRILQNKEHQYISCTAPVNEASIDFQQGMVRVEIRSTFLLNLEEKDSASAPLVLWLNPVANSFVISQVEGEKFYQAFTALKNNNEWSLARELAMKERVWVYEKANELAPQFDSVIWFVNYRRTNYFYVVSGGNWVNAFASYESRNEKNVNSTMGLVDSDGNIVIPLEYDLVGTIAFEWGDLVEVTKNKKVGYFDIEKKHLVIQPEYDVIIPYHFEDAQAIVKKDSVYGWFDKKFVYHDGFPSPGAKKWIDDFSYLRQEISFKNGNQHFAEIPRADFAGNGIVMPPSYLTTLGLFDPIIGGIATTEVPMNAWTEYLETKGSIYEKITEGIGALMTAVTERYLEGREEFYTTNRVVFMNNKRDTLAITTLPAGEVTFRQVDSTLLEFKAPPSWDHYVDVDGDRLPVHTYFVVEENTIRRLESTRIYSQTKFVKLDSSYIMETGTRWNQETHQHEETNGISLETAKFMRDEILDEYGYKFPDESRQNYFGTDGKYDSVEEFAEQLTDVDRHNLDFLARIITLLENGKPAV
jgi:hypothetical protein